MIKNVDAVRIIDEHRGEAVIVTTMGAGNQSFGLPTVTHRQELDLPVAGAMGKASSVALGLALAVPDRKVFVLDGDGSLGHEPGHLDHHKQHGAGEPVPLRVRERGLRRYRRPAHPGGR